MFIRRRFRLIKHLKKVFNKKPWFVLLIAIIIFAAFTTTVVYEQYVMNQDNLAQYLPRETVLYVHANTLESSHINKSWQRFLKEHEQLKTAWIDNLPERVFKSWPKVNNIKHQEIAFALVPIEEDYEPVLLLFMQSDDFLVDSIYSWQSQGFSVYRTDNVVIISKSKINKFNPNKKSLASKLKKERIPLANQFYTYIDIENYEKWSSKYFHSQYLDQILSLYKNQQDYLVFYGVVRDDSFIITTDMSNLANVKVKPQDSWLDYLPHKDNLLAKNIDLVEISQFLLDNGQVSAGSILDFHAFINFMNKKYDFDIVNDFILKLGGTANIYFSDLTNKRINNIEERDVVIEVKVKNDFSIQVFEDFLFQAASYKYPISQTKKLPDNTSYTELVAEPHEAIKISRQEIVSGIVLNSIKHLEEEWDWHYSLQGDKLLIANNKVLIESIVRKGLVEKPKPATCKTMGEQYLLINLPEQLSSNIGLESFFVNMTKDSLVVCTH